MCLQNFLCYSCKEYVEDLSKIPKNVVEVSLEDPEEVQEKPEQIWPGDEYKPLFNNLFL